MTCGDGRVTSVDLRDNKLSGSIPPELGNLTNLTSLDLYSNQLSGSIPPELGNLANLMRLYLTSNQLSGSIPPELANLGKLASLELSLNLLTGSIPPELGNLDSLQYLGLSGNQLSGSIPPELGSLASLQLLYLSGNQLSGSIPSELGNLVSVQRLHLYSNQLSGSIPPELGNLANLQLLDLHSNQLDGSIPPELGNLADLTELYLEDNQLTSIPPELGNLANLMRLYLYSNRLSGSIPPELGNLAYLQDFHLGINQLSGSIPRELGNLTNLTYLNLGGNQLDGSIPPELGNLGSLWYLSLSGNQLSGSIPPELGNLANLHSLYLSGNQLSGSISPELGSLANLGYLELGSNQLSGSIPPELGSLGSLQRLGLTGNQLNGSIPPELGNLASLQLLYLSSNQLSGSIPPELGNLANLWQLLLDRNQLSGSIPPELGNLANLWRLDLDYNQLSGSIPPELVNLVNVQSLDLQYNGLSAADPDVIAFLDAKDPDWATTQTVPPADLQVGIPAGTRVELTWTPIPYTGDGGYYEVSYATTPGGPYTIHGTTDSRTSTGYVADKLACEETYYFAVRSYTPAHDYQQNELWSEYSDEISGTTGDCSVVATFPFQDGFEVDMLGTGWSTHTTEQGRVRVDAGYAQTGSQSLLLDSGVDGVPSLAAADLRIDLQDGTDVQLDFWWRAFSAESHLEDGVFISDDLGNTWHQILSFNDSSQEFRQDIVDLDETASAQGLALNDQFLIRFQSSVDGPIPAKGYAIDEVRIGSSGVSVVYDLSTGLNLLPLKVETTSPLLAEAALDEIESQGGHVFEVYRWLSKSDTWEGHVNGKPFNDFPLYLGQGYFFRAGTDSTWQRIGSPAAEPVPVELGPIWTLLGLPNLGGLVTAGDLLNDANAQGGGCTEVHRWIDGWWDGHAIGTGPGFDLTDDAGYFMRCDNAITYTPGAGASQARAPSWPVPSEPEALVPVASPVISDVLVTNRRDVALSITWRTDQPSTGWVEYGEGTNLGQVAHDDLGEGTVSRVHHVTLTGLSPETTYYFRVHSGETVDDNDGQLYQVTTKATELPSMPYLAYGQVETADGGPAVGALVRVWVVDDEEHESEPLSAVVDGWGYWSLNLPVEACEDLTMKIQAIGHQGSETEMSHPACEVKPVSTVVLSEEGPSQTYLPLILR